MNQFNEGTQKELDGFERARRLREEAMALEEKERMKRRLLQLIEISEDPYYDQYLEQMLRDLESGKATVKQVAKEADRTFALYQQRMGKVVQVPPVNQGIPQMSVQQNASLQPSVSPQQAAMPVPGTADVTVQKPIQTQTPTQTTIQEQKPMKQKDTVEFKIGAGIFSTLGAVFVLAALVIVGFNFLEGFWQGLCLYAAGLAVILLSELLVKRLSPKFSLVITGIGISSLFIATVINYLVLKNMNGLVASVLTLVIGLLSILISRKKDAASIRLITFFGCYISFLPIKGFESELSFLIMTGMLLIINLTSIFLPNQSNRSLIGCVHMIAQALFTGIVTIMVLVDGMNVLYAAFFVVASLVILNLIYWQQRDEVKDWFSTVFGATVAFLSVFLAVTACFDHDLDNEMLFMFYKLLTEIMVLAVAVIFFILWGKRSQRWIQYYFVAGIIVLFNGFSDYKLEVTISTLALFVVTRLLSGKIKELEILDCIIDVIFAVQGFWMIEEWPVIPFVIVALIAILSIKKNYIFHEIVTTLFLYGAAICNVGNEFSWLVSIVVLFVLFLIFNHIPTLKGRTQIGYNVFIITLSGLTCAGIHFCDEVWMRALVMVIGAIMVLVVFRKRYEMEVPKRYFILVGYLVYMIFACGFETPVIVSGLLMLVAIACVAIGFWKKDKSYRICGLIMAVFVCVKLILFDFGELETLPKALLFLLVGVIALIISFIYIYIEKKEDKEEEEPVTVASAVQESVTGNTDTQQIPENGTVMEMKQETATEEISGEGIRENTENADVVNEAVQNTESSEA